MTKLEQLPTQIARAVLRVPDLNPKTGKRSTNEVLFTLRPSWANTGRYETALPGGKIDKADFEDNLDADALNHPSFILTLDQLIQAGLRAAEREVLEELGLVLTSGILQFVDKSTNKSGWTTFSYVADLAEKPTVMVKPNSAGTRWIDQEKIVNGNPRLLQGHLGITRRALKKLGE